LPYYYSINKSVTTNGSANTLSTHFRLATIANQMMARIMEIAGAARFGTAGGATLRFVRPGTIGSGGTANTPSKRNPNSRAADTTAFDDTTAITPGATPVIQMYVGVAQTGGHGGWVAIELDAAFAMTPNAGAGGQAEIASMANASSVVIDPTIGLMED
jgi:hypothetical protein